MGILNKLIDQSNFIDIVAYLVHFTDTGDDLVFRFERVLDEMTASGFVARGCETHTCFMAFFTLTTSPPLDKRIFPVRMTMRAS